MKKIVDFLIHSNIYLSLGASSLAYISCKLLGLGLRVEPLLITFSTTFFLYNLNRKTDIKEDIINYPERVKFLSKYGKIIFYVSMVFYILSLFIAITKSIFTFLIALIPTTIMILYAFFRLKKVFLLKNFIASLGWASMVLLVSNYYNLSFNISIFSVFFFIFLRLFINTIVFDIRDLKGDESSNIITIPVKIGINKTKKILHILNIFSFIFILMSTTLLNLNKVAYLTGFIALIYGFLFIFLINKINIKKLCEIVDGEMIILGIVCFLGSLAIK
jgi:4-hydroxybenzoate polyprenyltransferase